MIYNDGEVVAEFPSRMWVCVTDSFESITIAKRILECLEGRSCDVHVLEMVLQRIESSLRGKKFLLILDDLWVDERSKWEPLEACLSTGAKGSKILVTTRQEVTVVGVSLIYPLRPLDEQHCWSIIREMAFRGGENTDNVQLEEIGKKIAAKCDGLPLVAKELGGILRFKESLREWVELSLSTEIWEFDSMENVLFRSLLLSYDKLEPPVQRCFSYCAVFPKGSRIRVDKLIKIWMAHGFLYRKTSAVEMELLGQHYFEVLAKNSFFQDLKMHANSPVVSCTMHDSVHDFAQYLTKHECIIVDMEVIGGYRWRVLAYPRALHLFWPLKEMQETPNLESMVNARKLRSLFGSKGFPLDNFRHLKRVRLLSLPSCRLDEIPEEIGDFIRLRYLDLSENAMKELPEFICNLYNLQTLILNGCRFLSKLPQRIDKLRNLRHLVLDQKKFQYPLGIARLTNLRILKYIYAGKGCNNLGYLENMNQLGGTLEIRLENLDEAEDVYEAENAKLRRKESVESLHLQYDDTVKSQVVEALQPHSGLKHLTIEGFMMPGWIAGLRNLRTLVIKFSKPVNARSTISLLPPLWKLPFLEELGDSCPKLEYLGRDFVGLSPSHDNFQENVGFPALKRLALRANERWTEWEDLPENDGSMKIIMPRLEELLIFDSPQLEVLPHRLLGAVASLRTLHICMCPRLKESYKVNGAWREKVSHIRDVIFEY